MQSSYYQLPLQQQQPQQQYMVQPPLTNDTASASILEEGDSDESAQPDKRSGRRKIKIEYINDKSRRHITFSKRKAGIMKKAYELSTLTGTQVLLLVVSETGLVYTFTTPKLQPLVTKPEGKNLIQSCLNAPDPMENVQSMDSTQSSRSAATKDSTNSTTTSTTSTATAVSPNMQGAYYGQNTSSLDTTYNEDKKKYNLMGVADPSLMMNHSTSPQQQTHRITPDYGSMTYPNYPNTTPAASTLYYNLPDNNADENRFWPNRHQDHVSLKR
ncbi:hypothetical protein EDC96DRAFT_505758 [Choanephora cucurbitarum]|nr:hypothetical protein EDC96DRAFT_505758 [Choanephora cucurbitarum]